MKVILKMVWDMVKENGKEVKQNIMVLMFKV
jgi:hypothetical protein